MNLCNILKPLRISEYLHPGAVHESRQAGVLKDVHSKASGRLRLHAHVVGPGQVSNN
jgi:hypothetical protein